MVNLASFSSLLVLSSESKNYFISFENVNFFQELDFVLSHVTFNLGAWNVENGLIFRTFWTFFRQFRDGSMTTDPSW